MWLLLRARFILPALIWLVNLLPVQALAQGRAPYRLSWKTELGTLGVAGLMTGADLLLGERTKPLTVSQINSLDPASVWRPDRISTRQYSASAAHRSDAGLLSSVALGLGTSLLVPVKSSSDQSRANRWLTLPVMWWEANTLVFLATDLTKLSVGRTRPFVYQATAPLERKLELDARKSFFSGHTSLTATNAWFAARVFADYFPESRWKPVVWGLAIALPAWVGVERVLAGKHFPSDVLTGYAVGAFTGLLVPALHRSESKHLFPRYQKVALEWEVLPGGISLRW